MSDRQNVDKKTFLLIEKWIILFKRFSFLKKTLAYHDDEHKRSQENQKPEDGKLVLGKASVFQAVVTTDVFFWKNQIWVVSLESKLHVLFKIRIKIYPMLEWELHQKSLCQNP